MSGIVILAVCFQLKQLKKQLEKYSGLNGTRIHDLAIPVSIAVSIAIAVSQGHWFESRSSLNCFSGCFFNCLS